jgi:hypothetical protein
MVGDRPTTVEGFFSVRDRLVAGGRSVEPDLDQWDNQIRLLAMSEPDVAAHILARLAESGRSDDREVAAIYVGYLLKTRRGTAIYLLMALFADKNINVKRQAFETLDEVTSDQSEAAILMPDSPYPGTQH